MTTTADTADAILDRSDLPRLQVFHDIRVEPMRKLNARRFFGEGGPIWPDFAVQKSCRHNRNGKPADMPFAPDGRRAKKLAGDFVWGGFVQPHFGHLVAEHTTRLPLSLLHRPDDTYLYVISPRSAVDDIPDYFYTICEWIGLPRSQIMFVTRPVEVETLRVAPQAEQIPQRPSPQYSLALYERIARANGVTPVPSDLLNVTRAGLPAKAKAAHVGEGHLVQCLKAAGVQVLDPGAVSLKQQLSIYSGARRIVFSEGSAQHGRALLGHRAQDIVVLNRRPRMITAKAVLDPRCDSLRYVEATSANLAFMDKEGDPRLSMGRALAVYDLDVLFAAFRDFGVDLRAHWDTAAYQAAIETDILAWLKASQQMRAPGRFWPLTGELKKELARLGWGHILDRYEEIESRAPRPRVPPALRKGLGKIGARIKAGPPAPASAPTSAPTSAPDAPDGPQPWLTPASGLRFIPFFKRLHQIVQPRGYLEIGTDKGHVLEQARCASVAIDPQFRLDSAMIGDKPALHLLQLSSDEAFQSGAVDTLGIQVDIAFLDRMHDVESLLRDIANTERHMAPGGLIFVHDTCPPSRLAAGRARSEHGWIGDIWKILPILRDYRPDLSVRHLNCKPTGLTMIEGPWNTDTALSDRQDEIAARFVPMTLDDFGVDIFARDFPLVSPEGVLDELRQNHTDGARQGTTAPQER